MKTPHRFMIGLMMLACAPVFAQPANPALAQNATVAPHLIKFDIDFAGGTPGDLVGAIQAATGHPLNAIIPTADATVRLPAFKMKNVDAAQLFHALLLASHRRELHYWSDNGRAQTEGYRDTFFGFRAAGPISDDSIWYFHADRVRPAYQAPVFRCYLLTSYLDRGLSPGDIIAAIQAEWKLAGTDAPATTYLKETKILVAAGSTSQLDKIDDLLRVLRGSNAVAGSHK